MVSRLCPKKRNQRRLPQSLVGMEAAMRVRGAEDQKTQGVDGRVMPGVSVEFQACLLEQQRRRLCVPVRDCVVVCVWVGWV